MCRVGLNTESSSCKLDPGARLSARPCLSSLIIKGRRWRGWFQRAGSARFELAAPAEVSAQLVACRTAVLLLRRRWQNTCCVVHYSSKYAEC